MTNASAISNAVEVFVHAFSFLKSQHYPYPLQQIDGLWVMQDDPPRKRCRKIEIVTCGGDPAETVRKIQEGAVGHHFLCDFHPEEEFTERRQAYKSLGYRALGSEGVFVHDLINIPTFKTEPKAIQIESAEALDSIRQRSTQKRKWLDNTRLFCVRQGFSDIGWVRSVPVGHDAWVSDLYVHHQFRNQGYGAALMSKLLQVDRDCGVRTSVLTSSTLGSYLYPKLGYKKIAILQAFCLLDRNG